MIKLPLIKHSNQFLVKILLLAFFEKRGGQSSEDSALDLVGQDESLGDLAH